MLVASVEGSGQPISLFVTLQCTKEEQRCSWLAMGNGRRNYSSSTPIVLHKHAATTSWQWNRELYGSSSYRSLACGNGEKAELSSRRSRQGNNTSLNTNVVVSPPMYRHGMQYK